MTTEKAIQLLHRLQDEQFDGIHGDERREALEMAVRALESNLVKESGDLVKDLVEDCISRQAAIDALDIAPFDDYGDYMRARELIEQLPSAQPEIIRCKDCKHRDPEDKRCDCGHDILWQLPRDDNWYCADAERRSDDSD